MFLEKKIVLLQKTGMAFYGIAIPSTAAKLVTTWCKKESIFPMKHCVKERLPRIRKHLSHCTYPFRGQGKTETPTFMVLGSVYHGV